jgi:hypothetical protein
VAKEWEAEEDRLEKQELNLSWIMQIDDIKDIESEKGQKELKRIIEEISTKSPDADSESG